MYKVSIIVPIYNSEKTLKKCLDSLVNQTLKDIELILVDDGSTDCSSQICDEYKAKYEYIKVVHKVNEGMGKAYNLGISMAQGEYIGFVESDDWIENNMYEILYQNAIHYDSELVKCGLYYSDANGDVCPYLEHKILNNAALIKQPFTILDSKPLIFYHSSVWASLYKSDFIKKLSFSEEPQASYQDFSFMIKALVKASKISVVDGFFYHWNFSNEDASVKKTDARLMKILDQAIIAKDFLIQENMFEDLYSEFYKQVIISNCNFYNMIIS